MADGLTGVHIKKVAERIGTKWHHLGVELGISNNELENLANPAMGGPAEYAAHMLTAWYEGNANLSAVQVKDLLVDALEECYRNDVAEEVRTKLQTKDDIEKVFHSISGKLIRNWEDVGMCMNISAATRSAVKAHPGHPNNYRLEMLEMWQERTAPRNQRTQLIRALRELKREDIIVEIETVDEKIRPGVSRQESNLFAQPSQPSDDQGGMGQVVNGGVQPPSSVIEGSSNASLFSGEASVQEKMTVDFDDQTSARLNPHYEWMGSQFRRLRDEVTRPISQPVVIALLDSGVNTSHPDLKQGFIIGSKHFYPSDKENQDLTNDANNHGTVSAGILWQYTGDKNVKILNLKVLSSENQGSLKYVSQALAHIKQWDKENPTMPVDIVLMTLGHETEHNETNDHLSDMGKNKVLMCSAANEGQRRADSILSPAKHGSVIAVGSCDQYGTRCNHSAVGAKLAFLFPGIDIWSTSSKYRPPDETTRYTRQDGTSFAAPHCAALVAVILPFIEQELKGFQEQSGIHWRNAFTKSSRMEELIRDFCQKNHDTNNGYGVPDFKCITKNRIVDFITRNNIK